MPTEQFYQAEEMVIAHVDELANGSDFDIEASAWDENNVRLTTYIVGDACDIKYLAAADGSPTSSPETNITIDSFSGAGISEGNDTPIQNPTTAVRITSTSSTADFIAIGRVVED